MVTLGTLYIYRGITYSWAGGSQVNADELPGHFLSFANDNLLGVPWLVLIALVVVGGVSLVMRNYRVGRELYAMGSSPPAAELAGIRVARNLLGAEPGSKGTRTQCPSRRRVPFAARARSTRMRRMICDATPKNCERFFQSGRFCPTSRRNTS